MLWWCGDAAVRVEVRCSVGKRDVVAILMKLRRDGDQ